MKVKTNGHWMINCRIKFKHLLHSPFCNAIKVIIENYMLMKRYQTTKFSIDKLNISLDDKVQHTSLRKHNYVYRNHFAMKLRQYN